MANILKIIGKILVILVVASLVAGGLYLAVQNGSTSSSTTFSDRNISTQQFQNSGSTTSQPQFRPEGGDFGEGHGNFNLAQGLGGVLGALIKISIIATLVLFVQNLIVNMKRKPKASVA